MSRTRLRLAGFAAVLAALFTGGWAVGEQFPLDDTGTHDTGTHDTGTHDTGTHDTGHEVTP